MKPVIDFTYSVNSSRQISTSGSASRAKAGRVKCSAAFFSSSATMSKITNLSKYVGWVLRDPDVTDGPMWLVAAGHKGRCTVIEVNTGIRFTDGCLQSVFQRSDRALLWRNIAPGSRLTIAGHEHSRCCPTPQ